MLHFPVRTGALFTALWVLMAAAHASADQVIIADVTYTHSMGTVMRIASNDLVHHVTPAAGTPANWQGPVDYAAGSVHVQLEVKKKPAGDKPTRLQACFKGPDSYACTEQSPVYMSAGTQQWTSPFSRFFVANGAIDWSKGVQEIWLIIKDDMERQPENDTTYMPTDLRVEIALLSAGATYLAPAADAGAPMAGSAAPPMAGAAPPMAGAAPPKAGSAAPMDAGAPLDAGNAGRDASQARAGSGGAGGQAGTQGSSSGAIGTKDASASTPNGDASVVDLSDRSYPSGNESGCSSVHSTWPAPSSALATFAVVLLGMRRRRAQRTAS